MTPAETAAVVAKADRLHALASAHAARLACDPTDGSINRRKFSDCYASFIAGWTAASDERLAATTPQVLTK